MIKNKMLDYIAETIHKSNEAMYDVAKKAIKNYDDVSVKIMDKFKVDESGLLVGKVQSGKTNTFMSVISEAMDRGARVIIVLTGTKNDLNEQTLARLRDSFGKVSNNITVTDVVKDLSVLGTGGYFSHEEESIILVVKKHKKDLSDIYRHLDPKKHKNRVMIFDDEADHASHDNNRGKKAELEATGTNKKIVEIINLVGARYLAITATPQLQILLDQQADLKPKFIAFTQPGEGYCGVDTFHNGKFNNIKIIPDDEAGNIRKNCGNSASLNASFATFLLTIYKSWEVDGTKKWCNMLINIDKKTIMHEKLQEVIESMKVNVFSDPLQLRGILEEIPEEYERILGDISVDIVVEWITDKILNSDNRFSVEIVNKDHKYCDKDRIFTIYIGGEKLSRGLTISNLTVTLFLRDPKKPNVDTTLQRARWFGYRESTLPYTYLFMTRKIMRDFEELHHHEMDVWSKQEECIQDFTLLLSNRLKPTRSTATNHVEGAIRLSENRPRVEKGLDAALRLFDPIEFELAIDKDKFMEGYDYTVVSVDAIINRLKELYEEDRSIKLLEIINLLELQSSQYKNSIMRVIFMKSEGNYRMRQFDDGKVNQLFQGRSKDNVSYCGDTKLVENAPNRNSYIGDLQVHFVKGKGDFNQKTIMFAYMSKNTQEVILKADSDRRSNL